MKSNQSRKITTFKGFFCFFNGIVTLRQLKIEIIVNLTILTVFLPKIKNLNILAVFLAYSIILLLLGSKKNLKIIYYEI